MQDQLQQPSMSTEQPVNLVLQPSGVFKTVERAMDGTIVQELGVHPIVVQGIARKGPEYPDRIYFELEEQQKRLVRLKSWTPKECPLDWNRLITVQGFVRVKTRKGAIEPELEVIGVQGSGELVGSRDERRERFLAAIQAKKHAVDDVFLQEKPHVVLITSEGGEADRDIQSQLVGYRNELSWEVIPVRMTVPQSVANAITSVQARVRSVDLVIVARGGGEGLEALETDDVLKAVASRAIPVVCAIGHARQHILLDELVDLSFPTPTAAGQWLMKQLELKVRRTADEKRLAELKVEEKLRKSEADLLELTKVHALELGRLAAAQGEQMVLSQQVSQLSRDQRRWRIASAVAWAIIIIWLVGKLAKWW